MRVSIFSFAHNTKFPIGIVYRQFKKYLKDDFEYILFNDANDLQTEADINTETSCNNIKCVRIPQHIHKIHNPSESYAETLNWALHEHAAKNDYELIVLMHTDIFPICDVSIVEIIGNYTVASTVEFRIIDGKGINYLYPALTIINIKNLKDPNEINFDLLPGLDVGGKTKEFIEKYPESVKFLANYQAEYMKAILHDQPIAEYFEEDIRICRAAGLSAGWVAANGLYHYMAGSAWNINENPLFAAGHNKRMQLFLKYFY